MKKTHSFMAVFAICSAFLTSSLLAANRGGVQGVVFPNWNTTSVGNLVAAVNEVKPADFELAQCPYFGGESRWNNTIAFLKGVSGSVGLTGTMFLSFHSDRPGWHADPDGTLRARSANLSSFLKTPQSGLGNATPISKLKYLVLSPQLEDEWNDDTWKSKVKIMLDQMDEQAVLKSGKLNLRRSINPGKSTSLAGTSYSYKRGENTYTFAVRVEIHKFPASSTGSWSNDGDFVFFPTRIGNKYEDSSSASDSKGAITNRKPLSDFISSARNRNGASTLWRPAYNLWRRSESSGKITWTRDANVPAPWDRTDGNTTFDAREKAALVAYLTGLK